MSVYNFLNRCAWNAVSSGTGDFVVSSAISGYYTPAGCANPSVSNGKIYHYFAINGSEHEEGDGAFNTGTSTLARTTVRNSSTGAKVSFSSAPIVYMGGPVSNDMQKDYVTSSLASVSAITLTTVTPANITSVSVPAGTWDLWGNVWTAGNS